MLGSGVAVEGRKGDPIDVSISREIRLQPFFAMCVRQSDIKRFKGSRLMAVGEVQARVNQNVTFLRYGSG